MKFGTGIRAVIEVCMQTFKSLTFPFPETWRHKFCIFMRKRIIGIRHLPPGNGQISRKIKFYVWTRLSPLRKESPILKPSSGYANDQKPRSSNLAQDMPIIMKFCTDNRSSPFPPPPPPPPRKKFFLILFDDDVKESVNATNVQKCHFSQSWALPFQNFPGGACPGPP